MRGSLPYAGGFGQPRGTSMDPNPGSVRSCRCDSGNQSGAEKGLVSALKRAYHPPASRTDAELSPIFLRLSGDGRRIRGKLDN